jgi:hypothetical protein
VEWQPLLSMRGMLNVANDAAGLHPSPEQTGAKVV